MFCTPYNFVVFVFLAASAKNNNNNIPFIMYKEGKFVDLKKKNIMVQNRQNEEKTNKQ